ncbi:hypothetical protein LTS18_005363 [Coniosporium uncinatum]|uniref:Uncharacterized protein n=1 Tax=Coniosporium uncinatum TaxID=93489 RepID=A0ACC3DRS7_9PEZI|nr:hypothetical protein LTS18_005363 [Coniosporium uncinatum]
MSDGKVEKDLLSLDGGGIKGISSLLILNAVMTRVRAIEGRDLEQERLPKDYFDLAARTSTGGLVARMLFRLNMSTSQVIQQYDSMAKRIFAPTVFGLDLQKYLGGVGYWLGSS